MKKILAIIGIIIGLIMIFTSSIYFDIGPQYIFTNFLIFFFGVILLFVSVECIAIYWEELFK